MGMKSKRVLAEDIAAIVDNALRPAEEDESDSVSDGAEQESDDSKEGEKSEEGGDEEVVESISDGAIDRLVDSMLTNPKTDGMLSRFGVSPSAVSELRAQLSPVMKAVLSSAGVKVSGASTAKRAVKDLARR